MRSGLKGFLHFNLRWLGYLGFLGIIGFLRAPLRPFRLAFLLCLFLLVPYLRNPHFFFQILYYACGQMVALFRVRGKIPRPDHYAQKTSFSLPFEGLWTVAHGGVNKRDSHSWNVFNQRYAYDFFVKGENQATCRNAGKALEDYYCFGKAILAPADGLVVQAKNAVRDNPALGSIDLHAPDFRGNFVIIRHAEGEYSHLAHFKKGSISVEHGDKVKRGQVIGLAGNSGHTTEPHLHFHVQDRANFFFAIGLPVKFGNYILQSEGQVQRIESGYISKGQMVKNGGRR